jgi:hypothetical protein
MVVPPVDECDLDVTGASEESSCRQTPEAATDYDDPVT